MAYDLLNDLLVLEVAQFGPDSLGGYLADLGARVIKVEDPDGGDPLRRAGAFAVGSDNGFSYMHLRWNRGKESVIIDLSSEGGRKDFLKLAAQADIVIEGMRAGVMDRLGLGFDMLRQVNPAIVFCSLSGLGESGPYVKRASHGPSFDAFGGLGLPVGEALTRWQGPQPTLVGMHACGLSGALATVAAVLRARRTGEGVAVEIAAAECAAHWLPEALDPLLNPQVTHERPGFFDQDGKMRRWARMDNYRCADGKLLFLMSHTDKSWEKLLKLIDRPDLDAIYQRTEQIGLEDAGVHAELTTLFATQPRAYWLDLALAHDLAIMPVNTPADLIEDPHFTSRPNVYASRLPDGTELKLTSTPIRVRGQNFTASAAPDLGDHSAAIFTEFDLGEKMGDVVG